MFLQYKLKDEIISSGTQSRLACCSLSQWAFQALSLQVWCKPTSSIYLDPPGRLLWSLPVFIGRVINYRINSGRLRQDSYIYLQFCRSWDHTMLCLGLEAWVLILKLRKNLPPSLFRLLAEFNSLWLYNQGPRFLAGYQQGHWVHRGHLHFLSCGPSMSKSTISTVTIMLLISSLCLWLS